MINSTNYRPVYETEIASYNLSLSFFEQLIEKTPIYRWTKSELGNDRSLKLFFIIHVKYKIFSHIWDFFLNKTNDITVNWNYEKIKSGKIIFSKDEIDYIISILLNPFSEKDFGEHYYNVIMDNIRPIKNKNKAKRYSY